jgi:hypothetical protein
MALTDFFGTPVKGCLSGLFIGGASFFIASKNQNKGCWQDLDFLQTAANNAAIQGAIGATYGLCAMLIRGPFRSDGMIILASKVMMMACYMQTVALTEIQCNPMAPLKIMASSPF